MRRISMFAVAGFCAAGLAGCKAPARAAAVRPAPAFELPDLKGGKATLDTFKGKVVVVDFWATWCAPCVKELPELADYHERLRGSDKVVLLSFNATDERDEILDFVRRERTAFPVYVADDLLDRFEVFAFPTKLILDFRREPAVERCRRVGYTPVESIEARVREVLDHPAATD